MRLLPLTLAAAAVAIAPASAPAAPVLVGGHLPAGATQDQVGRDAMALTIKRASAGGVVVRVAVAARCTRFVKAESDVLTAHGGLDAGGHIRVFEEVDSEELGHVVVSVTGVIGDLGGGVTARVFSVGTGTGRCETGHKTFDVARLSTPKTTGPPPKDAILAGVTAQQEPFVARTDRTGTRLAAVFATTRHLAREVDHGKADSYTVDYELPIVNAPIRSGRVDAARRFRLGRTQGQDWSLMGRIGSGGLVGRLDGSSFHRVKGYARTTSVKDVAVRAVPTAGAQSSR